MPWTRATPADGRGRSSPGRAGHGVDRQGVGERITELRPTHPGWGPRSSAAVMRRPVGGQGQPTEGEVKAGAATLSTTVRSAHSMNKSNYRCRGRWLGLSALSRTGPSAQHPARVRTCEECTRPNSRGARNGVETIASRLRDLVAAGSPRRTGAEGAHPRASRAYGSGGPGEARHSNHQAPQAR